METYRAMFEYPAMAGRTEKQSDDLQRMLRADPVRRALQELIDQRDVDYKTVSLAIGRNHSYIQQFLKRGMPAKLPEDVREALGHYFKVSPELFRDLSTMAKRGAAKRASTSKVDEKRLARELAGYTAVPGAHLSVAEDSFSVDDEDYVFVSGYDASVSAGPGSMVSNEQTPLYRNAFRLDWLRSLTMTTPNRLAVLRVVGDSMEPTLHHGDHVLVDRSVDIFGHDGLYVLNKNSALFVKRVHCTKGSGLVDIISDNQLYPAETNQDPDQFRVEGRVIWLGRNVG